jgi:hypothetical protein
MTLLDLKDIIKTTDVLLLETGDNLLLETRDS